MTEDFNLEAFRYLLDQLDAKARVDFEALLARDPIARAALKACTAAVAQFACETAPAEPMPPATQRAALAAILANIATEPRPRLAGFSWKRFAWPLAASILLVLNLVQYFRPASNHPVHAKEDIFANSEPVTHGDTSSSHDKRIQGQAMEANKADPHGLKTATSTDATVTDELHRLEKLRTEYATLERAREALNTEYNGIIRQLAEHSLVSKGVGRMAAMELVDAGSYARGERKGLVDIARGLLTEPGIVTVEPIPIPPETSAPKLNPMPDPLAPAPDPTASTLPTVPNTTPQAPANSIPTNPSTTPGETPQAGIQNQTESYAWSVFDEASSRGYLNLYNLPTTPPDQSLQLWVKVANTDAYQRIGEVPAQFYGKSGSLSYNLPGATQPPSDILITQEPRNVAPTQPTGPTILHGP
jgi:anti-sigma-K factor RskA